MRIATISVPVSLKGDNRVEEDNKEEVVVVNRAEEPSVVASPLVGVVGRMEGEVKMAEGAVVVQAVTPREGRVEPLVDLPPAALLPVVVHPLRVAAGAV